MQRALIVGGGPGGMTTAIALSRVGVRCVVVELETDWRPAGVGIALHSAPLRALKAIDLFEDIIAAGFASPQLEVTQANGQRLAVVEQPNVNDADDPPFVTMSRVALHEVLAQHLRENQVKVRLGTTVEALVEDADHVRVTLSDGTIESYDLVVGADGVNSKVRGMILPDAEEPQFAGQVIWRLGARRPARLERYTIMVAGPHRIGLVPLPAGDMYLWILDNTLGPTRPAALDLLRLFHERMEVYGGVAGEVAAQATDPAQLDFRALHWLILPEPWHSGRVLLLGDAAHTTTPHMAFGVALAIEDAIVLSELVRDGVDAAELGGRFTARRYERCRLVVEGSLQLSRWEQEQGPPKPDAARLTEATFARLAAPI